VNERKRDTAEGALPDEAVARRNPSTCPACGAAFECGMEAGLAECWCSRLPPVVVTPGLGCLCPRCLAARAPR
jgi:hypothetical protein